jgi:putative lipoprotein
MRPWSWAAAPFAAALLLAPAPALAAPPDPDPWFGPDKALHFTVSSLVAGGGYGMTAIFSDRVATRIAFGAGLGLAVGAGKELWDLSGHGHPSWKDFTWDVIGTVFGVGIAVTIDLATRGPERVPAR